MFVFSSFLFCPRFPGANCADMVIARPLSILHSSQALSSTQELVLKYLLLTGLPEVHSTYLSSIASVAVAVGLVGPDLSTHESSHWPGLPSGYFMFSNKGFVLWEGKTHPEEVQRAQTNQESDTGTK